MAIKDVSLLFISKKDTGAGRGPGGKRSGTKVGGGNPDQYRVLVVFFLLFFFIFKFLNFFGQGVTQQGRGKARRRSPILS